MSLHLHNLLVQMRPSHWAKNVLILVPLLTSQQFFVPELWPAVLLVFAAFCLAASAGYQLNDLLDLEADRQHRQKATRPLAAGRLTSRAVVALCLSLSLGSVGLALAVNLQVAAIVVAYIAFSALYSIALKRFAVADVLSLAIMYCARIFAGAAAIGVIVSPYLLAFSLFFFVSLALMKRYIALAANEAIGPISRTAYGKGDSTILLIAGVTTALASLALLALYIDDAEVRARYSSPDLLWGVWLVLLYGVLRGWLAANRGRLDEDLAGAAVRDPGLWIVGVAVVALFLVAY